MIKLSCHCGNVEAEINVPERMTKFLRCNCSLCKRKGAVMSMVKNEDFKITKGKYAGFIHITIQDLIQA